MLVRAVRAVCGFATRLYRLAIQPFVDLLAGPAKTKRTKKNGDSDVSPTARGWARLSALFLFVLAFVDLAISIPHLITGVQQIAQCSLATAIFAGISFDLSQLGAKLAIAVGRFVGLDRRTNAAAWSIVFVFTALSVSLNVKAFVAHASTPLDITYAVAWGLILPVSVLILFSVGMQLLLASAGNQQGKK